MVHNFKGTLVSEVRGFEEKTGVLIEYIKDNLKMKLSGLLPDNPPYVCLERDKILASEDDKTYYEVEWNVGFQALRLLDPRIVLQPKVSRILYSKGKNFFIEYDLIKINEELLPLKFPKQFMERMKRFNELKRPVICTIEENKILQLRQKNLPPSEEHLNIIFSYT